MFILGWYQSWQLEGNVLFVLLRIHLTLGYVNVRNLNNYDVLMFKALYAHQGFIYLIKKLQ